MRRVFTHNSRLSSADLCRLNGWRRGTLLVGDEGRGPEVIRITAVGDESILAMQVMPPDGWEADWDLRCRNWRRIYARQMLRVAAGGRG